MPPFMMKAIWAVVIVIAVVVGFRLWLASHDAALLEGYVLKQERDTLQSHLVEKERQRLAVSKSLEDYRKRVEADERQDEAERQRMEQIIANDSGDGCGWNDSDRVWLCEQGIASACIR